MKSNNLTLVFLVCISIFSCKKYIKKTISNYTYYNKLLKDTIAAETLKIITKNDEYLEYGVDVAFINNKNDTVIPFGKYAYFGTDSLSFYTPVLEHPNDSTFGRKIAIDRNENILFDMVMYDNGPDFFKEDLIRVQRNGKMGYANKFGQVVIPCIYDFQVTLRTEKPW